MLLARHERLVIALLSLVGALRVVIFSAAFPFFNNVDEALHFNVVQRYSLGRIPRAYDRLADETVAQIARYGSAEFMVKPSAYPESKFPPPVRKQPPAVAEPIIAATARVWSAVRNFELSQPPLYYALAALWLDIGRVTGAHGLFELYWIRFLNALLLLATVWLGYGAARLAFPANQTVTFGVPLLIAFFPEAIFFSIQNDVLSTVVCAAVFACVLRSTEAETVTVRAALLSGLALAAAYLSKLSNLPFIVIASVAFAGCMWKRKMSPAALALFLAAAAIPIGAWMWWSKAHFGDISGSAEKIAMLGWQRKPFTEWLAHPLFSLRGFWTFLSDLLATYWRGELVWEGETLRNVSADAFYIGSSIVLPFAALVAAIRSSDSNQRRAVLLSAIWVATGVAFLALLSLEFEFGGSVYPSRDFPYFTSGRLIAGSLVPFTLLYVRGLDVLLSRWNPRLPLAALAVIIIFVTVSAIVVNAPVFASEHNLFHP